MPLAWAQRPGEGHEHARTCLDRHMYGGVPIAFAHGLRAKGSTCMSKGSTCWTLQSGPWHARRGRVAGAGGAPLRHALDPGLTSHKPASLIQYQSVWLSGEVLSQVSKNQDC